MPPPCLLTVPAHHLHPIPLQWDGLLPRPSFEGSEQRCFQHMFVCGRRFKAMRALEEQLPLGEAAARQALMRAIPRENYAYGQMLVEHVQQQQQQMGSNGAGQPSTAAGRGGRRLRVAFMKRGGQGRQLLNARELLQRCNKWRHKPPGGGATITAECREVRRGAVLPLPLPSCLRPLHGAGRSGVSTWPGVGSTCSKSPHLSLVCRWSCRVWRRAWWRRRMPTCSSACTVCQRAAGSAHPWLPAEAVCPPRPPRAITSPAHPAAPLPGRAVPPPPPAGANMANSWLMRPGSSAIEISPYEFGLMPGSFGLSKANAQVGLDQPLAVVVVGPFTPACCWHSCTWKLL